MYKSYDQLESENTSFCINLSHVPPMWLKVQMQIKIEIQIHLKHVEFDI